MPLSGSGVNYTHILKTGLMGRFALSVVDDLVAVHHQSSQTSQLFDIMEECKVENTVIHLPLVPAHSIRPAVVDEQPCPMCILYFIISSLNVPTEGLGTNSKLRLGHSQPQPSAS
ncbi:hypothetical protein RR48_00180 [Papilio machaon]|uniref:Uncharacterized protein n=1 Tax=Papilio machaon TaxID=76193 RepID=A0A0N1ICX7_PAPMA|nr:hypothetical protein RR48_00180 [Papilio machaon]